MTPWTAKPVLLPLSGTDVLQDAAKVRAALEGFTYRPDADDECRKRALKRMRRGPT